MCVWDVIARRTFGLADALADAARGVEADLARERPPPPRKPLPRAPGEPCPGSPWKYKKGLCRCDACRTVYAAWRKADRAKKREKQT